MPAGAIAGTAGATIFPGSPPTGWVHGIVVRPEYQRTGLGARLTEAAIEWLQARSVGAVQLLATDAGRPVYERLGFTAGERYGSFAWPTASPDPAATNEPMRPSHLRAVLALDREATGEDRSGFIMSLAPSGWVAVRGPRDRRVPRRLPVGRRPDHRAGCRQRADAAEAGGIGHPTSVTRPRAPRGECRGRAVSRQPWGHRGASRDSDVAGSPTKVARRDDLRRVQLRRVLRTWGARGAPQTPQRSGHPGAAGAPLDSAIRSPVDATRRLYSRAMGSEPRLLDGIRVIDAASFIAGPVATTAMADFGADVIKIEPPGGDTYRVRNAGYPPSPYNFPWIVDNRNKRGLALDLRTDDGRRVLHRLVRERRRVRDQRAARRRGPAWACAGRISRRSTRG